MENSDDYKHVCWKDLKSYLNTSNFLLFLKSSSKAFIQELRTILGIKDITIDKNLNSKSTNPVENKAIVCNLQNKANKSELNKVAYTGQYRDLQGIPTAISNPYGLIIKDKNEDDIKYYDGSKALQIIIPNVNEISQKFEDINQQLTNINNQISTKENTINTAINTAKTDLQSNIETETTRALAAETALNKKLDKIIQVLILYTQTTVPTEKQQEILKLLNS